MSQTWSRSTRGNCVNGPKRYTSQTLYSSRTTQFQNDHFIHLKTRRIQATRKVLTYSFEVLKSQRAVSAFTTTTCLLQKWNHENSTPKHFLSTFRHLNTRCHPTAALLPVWSESPREC